MKYKKKKQINKVLTYIETKVMSGFIIVIWTSMIPFFGSLDGKTTSP